MPTEIKANANIILVITASEPRQCASLPHIVGFVERPHDPMTLGRPTMWLLARLIRRCCLLTEVVISKGVGETNPGVGPNWPSREASYPYIRSARVSAFRPFD